MTTLVTVAWVLLGLALGGVAGGGAGVFAGLAYTEWAGTSCLEGLCGYVVALGMVAGVLLGLPAGAILGWRLRRRSLARRTGWPRTA